MANAERKRRFALEAKAASALNHPSIITIYDIDAADGVDFIAMGTPEKDKRHIVDDSAHDVMVNRTEVVKEVLSWLDQYLGPVAR